jgi:deoxyribodipyrimidine photo-lyase
VHGVDKFPATRESALQRLEDFLALAPRYAAARNQVLPGHPQVSRLSAAIRHRLITEREVVEAALRRYPFRTVEKFLQEVLWRGYWKGWLEMRPQAWDDYTASVRRLSAPSTPAQTWRAVAEGRSRSGIMNHFASELIETGYLHNHARMWWSSYWIHYCGLPWELGAAFFMEHLLDADAASNTLSWRWVAGLQTRGKTYLATEQNIRKFCAAEILEKTGGAELGDGMPEKCAVTGNLPDYPVSETHHLTECPTGDRARRLALVLHDEDMNLENSPAADLRPEILLHFVPETETTQSSPKVRWLDMARADAVRRAREHFRCEVHVCRSAGELARSCRRESVDQLFLLEPFVGPLRDELRELPAHLSPEGVTLCGLRRRWDIALQPHAERGFFPFWNRVGRKLAKAGVEGVA